MNADRCRASKDGKHQPFDITEDTIDPDDSIVSTYTVTVCDKCGDVLAEWSAVSTSPKNKANDA